MTPSTSSCCKAAVPATPQLAAWTGEFGDDYIRRHEAADWKLTYGVEAFRRMVGGLALESVLEVGSNIGLNLWFLRELFGPRLRLFAVEPNRTAYERLLADNDLFHLSGHVLDHKAFPFDVFRDLLNVHPPPPIKTT
uniref:FkbM family methyltransferase n=1 Tax=Desulfobacca acetoxidans TaxID=60893 RepID=A0A7V4LDC5_9BACT